MEVSADSVPLRSDCTNAQADFELHCPHTFEDPFSHDAAQIYLHLEDEAFIVCNRTIIAHV